MNKIVSKIDIIPTFIEFMDTISGWQQLEQYVGKKTNLFEVISIIELPNCNFHILFLVLNNLKTTKSMK